MRHSLGPVPNPNGTPGEEWIEAADLQAAIRIATERAFVIIEADLAAGRLNPGSTISIRDDNGKTVHVVRFRDIVGDAGAEAN